MIINVNNNLESHGIAAALGCSDVNIVKLGDNLALDSSVLEPWNELCLAAKTAGFDLAIASAYRSFERQKWIWNAKLSGKRSILDENNRAIEVGSLSSLERIEKLMRWSALPGASRHHWGSDMDIYDRSAVEPDYDLQLVSDEYTGKGPFAPLIIWLREYLSQSASPDFFFPYLDDHGGISPEPWHISYRPVAESRAQHWSLAALIALLQQETILEQETVLDHIDNLYKRFIMRSINP